MIEINIRNIQHYLYCPHRWGLLEIDKAWSENYFVTKSNIFHDNVHNSNNYINTKNVKIYTSVPVYNDLEPYYLYGILDCLEIRAGLNAQKNDGLCEYEISIIEYKPTKPKHCTHTEDDLMQVFAQKICVDYTFGCDAKAYIYYGDVKRRYELPLRENFSLYDEKLKDVLTDIRTNIQLGIIPEIKKGQNCNGCSMKDLCIPSAIKKKNIKAELLKLIKED